MIFYTPTANEYKIVEEFLLRVSRKLFLLGRVIMVNGFIFFFEVVNNRFQTNDGH